MARGTIVVLHLAGRYPLGGIGWQALHHLIALRRLGWDVWYLEDSGAAPYDPRSQSVVIDCARNVAFLRDTLERFGFRDRWGYFDVLREEWHGVSAEAAIRLYGEADALLNVCGATALREEHLACPVRILVETDPVYPQARVLAGDATMRAEIAAHTHYFSYGENLGGADCRVPAVADFACRPTRPPVVVEEWADSGAPGDRLTTVATWRNAGKDVTIAGEPFRWSKHANFLDVVSIPTRTPQRFELALGNVDDESAARLRRNGWLLADPWERSRDVQAFRDYVCGSFGEFTVAKDLVARTNSGWFSDRSVCYLAAGRPVVTQETGFSRFVPTGEGLFSFRTADEALAAVDAIRSDYPRHSRAARAIASEYFAAGRTLGALLAECGLG